MNILQINSSIHGEDGHSSRLANLIVSTLQQKNPCNTEVRKFDLSVTPLPELDRSTLAALGCPAEKRTPEQQRRTAIDDEVIADAQWADTLVLGVPMYNFNIPAQLKNWIDAVTKAQVTFRYTATGPEGLLKNKKAYVALARGGKYRDNGTDTQAPYLKMLLGFIGITDIRLFYAEGLALGEDSVKQSIDAAAAEIRNLS